MYQDCLFVYLQTTCLCNRIVRRVPAQQGGCWHGNHDERGGTSKGCDGHQTKTKGTAFSRYSLQRTSKHSSRTRTARFPSSGECLPNAPLPRCRPPTPLNAKIGRSPWRQNPLPHPTPGGRPTMNADPPRQTPSSLWTDRQTGVKTLPSRNLVCGR